MFLIVLGKGGAHRGHTNPPTFRIGHRAAAGKRLFRLARAATILPGGQQDANDFDHDKVKKDAENFKLDPEFEALEIPTDC